VREGIHMHSCRRILFICTVQSSATCACIAGVSQHLHACVWGDWKWGFFQLVHG